jgi:hypothetical protein
MRPFMSADSAQAGATAIVLRGVGVRVLVKALNQQRQEGRAAVSLIESAAAAAPTRGAPEPGKGTLVDVTA